MKIFCVGRNYADHVKELKNDLPTEPLIFMKPSTALLLDNKPLYYPDFTQNLHHEVEIVVLISKNGKHIEQKFASKYYDKIALGIDFTARDLQDKFKSTGNPWELCKGFDNSAVLSRYYPIENYDLKNTSFHLTKNGEIVQVGNTKDFIFEIDTVISFISKYITLQQGDLIYTGTPAGVSAVKIGDKLEGFLESVPVFNCEIK
jgi:acylpyruvate hydrolase